VKSSTVETALEEGVRAAPAIAPAATPISLRAIDVVGSAVLLILLMPLLLLIAIAIRIDSRGPVLFRQPRCGIGRRGFTIAKFRTMHRGTAATPHREYVTTLIQGGGGKRNGLYKLQDDPRITRVGRVLRRLSLDELPQLWNVLKGDMALVGPRPPIPYEVEHYPPGWLDRLTVKPGMTGLWQVSGRNELSYDEMVELDLEYVRRRSLRLNLRILVATFGVVIRGRGAV
jgi:lipopolysaccharide/colanic/teichoic acid biosynthesis glycosyltransferase